MTPPSDYILKTCDETISVGSNRLAANTIDPAGALAIYLGRMSNRDIYSSLAADTIKISLLEATKHGELITKIGSVGRTYYVYDPVPGYAGKDNSVFMTEFEGKRYKIIIELHVFSVAPVESTWVNSCPPSKLIKVNGKPVSGSSSYDLNTITVTFADLAGGAVGQAVGNTITLDDNAAGHNWYIDTTPWDNSEYLPTSNPYEWVVRIQLVDATH